MAWPYALGGGNVAYDSPHQGFSRELGIFIYRGKGSRFHYFTISTANAITDGPIYVYPCMVLCVPSLKNYRY